MVHPNMDTSPPIIIIHLQSASIAMVMSFFVPRRISDSKIVKAFLSRLPSTLEERPPYITSSWTSPTPPKSASNIKNGKRRKRKGQELVVSYLAITHCVCICPNLKI